MTRVVSNAFVRSANRQAGSHQTTQRGFSPLTARVLPIADGVRLTLAPMRAVDLLPVWARERGPEFRNLVLSAGPMRLVDGRPLSATLQRLVERLQLDHASIDPHAILLADAPLVRLLSQVEFKTLTLVRIEGPVEISDVHHIRRALSLDGSALEAELRATQVARVEADETVTFDARDPQRAFALVTENFRHYLAAILNEPLSTVGQLAPWQVQRLLECTGSICVRPIETQVYSTSIDIGVSTQRCTADVPADQSLIYDRPSASWHDEG